VIKFIELFAGIGGFRNGLGHFECVWANEIDKYSASIYRKQFGDKELYEGDIRNVEARSIPDHDLLVGGFPCQAFSIAGKRAGFDDTRGTLFFEIARILRDKRPRCVLLENVKGLLSHDSGKTFQTVLKVLADIGYRVEWQVLNSKNFGVPQNRERLFIVGHLGGQPRRKVFPIGESNGATFRTRHVEHVSGTLSTKNQSGQAKWDGITTLILKETQKFADAQRVRTTDGNAVTLKGLGGGMGAKTGLYAIPVLTPDRPIKRQNGRRFKTDGEVAFTQTAQDRHGVYDGARIRRLTPVECERLQGFPDNFTKLGIDTNGKSVEISDTQRYKVLGNAVTTNVITAIGENINND